MKPTLMFTTLTLLLASPALMAKSEVETLRSQCNEQKRQIRQLEDENAKLRLMTGEKESKSVKSEPVSAPASKTIAKQSEPTTAPVTTTANSATYTVKAGDSFERIARKVGTTQEKLAKSNGLKTSSMIHPGQALKVPGSPTATSSQVVAKSNAPASGAKSHKVMPGETFSSISKKHGIRTEDLIAANPTVKPSTLRPGQVVSLVHNTSSTQMISASSRMPEVQAPQPAVAKTSPPVPKNIPVSTPAPKPTPAPASKPVSAPEKQAVVESTPVNDKKVHPVTIDGEMTYGEFASKHGTDTSRLNALNGLDLTNATILAKGSELYIPAQP